MEGMKTIHICGESDPQQTLFQIPLSVRFKSDLSSKEHDPVIGVHSTMRKPPRVGYTQFPAVWEKDNDGTMTIEHHMVVNIGIKHPWPRDASVVVQLFAHSKSSEGIDRLQKTGSCLIPLMMFVDDSPDTTDGRHFVGKLMKRPAQIFDNLTFDHTNVESYEKNYRKFPMVKSHYDLYKSVDPSTDSSVQYAEYEYPLILESSRMLTDKPFFKGSIVVRHKYGSGVYREDLDTQEWKSLDKIERRHFSDPYLFDVTSQNTDFIESRVMFAINRDMFPFSQQFKQEVGISHGLPPSIPILDKIHFPFFVTDSCPLPGNRYFTNHSGENNHDQKLYTRLMEISLERNFMDKEEFIRMGGSFVSGKIEDPDDFSGDVAYNTKMTKSASAFVEACTILANSIPYVGDYDDFNHDRRFRNRFDKHKYHVTTESCDDPFAKGSDDCEGDANAITRIYRGFRDMKNIPAENKLLHAAQSFARNYMCFGVLGTVNSRNIKESENAAGQEDDDDDTPDLGTKKEVASGSGAHMWTMFVPMRYSLRMLQRTWRKGEDPSTEKVKWTDGTTMDDYAQWTERLPVLFGEGTGLLDPKLAPISCYYTGLENKRDAINNQVKKKDAYVRLMMGQTIRNMIKSEGKAKVEKAGELSNMDVPKFQDMVIEHRNKRLSPFYHRIATMFPIVTEDEKDCADVVMESHPLPKKWDRKQRYSASRLPGNEPETTYSWRSIVPVQMNKGRPHEWQESFLEPGAEYAEFDLNKAYWGITVEDLVFKRDNIAFVRLPENTPIQEASIRSITRLLPPLRSLEHISDKKQAKIDKIVGEINKEMDSKFIERRKYGKAIPHDHKAYTSEKYTMKKTVVTEEGEEITEDIPTRTIRLFTKAQDMNREQATAIIDRVVECPYTIGAKFTSEIVCPVVGSIRLDVIVDNSDAVQFKEPEDFTWSTESAMY